MVEQNNSPNNNNQTTSNQTGEWWAVVDGAPEEPARASRPHVSRHGSTGAAGTHSEPPFTTHARSRLP